ncbi:helix-turn-helix transcriptional regulator [Paenibacillus larvae]|uniref:helix-turn-helix domain-containing protein n=1 Tax=Paenibacillus larvae TaxID=1464 RepID=UPI0022814078|nr:helix-turn-helix transcriptional regulator [Paenibacillus larvae]MCY9509077.1 helix-turn-helix transcriptional regulator [Paenibacillus larvae]MCY9527298.1 helix-turn-helix transcriptional regulator [Paenibacillus larvae]
MHRIEMKKARNRLGKSQRVMSIELDLSESYIRQIEYGVKEPGGKTMLKISRYLGVPAEILFNDLLS